MSTHRVLPWGLVLAGVMLSPVRARAGPNEGEGRTLLRDADRVYTVVAGEGDGASTVVNPANLGFLQGVNGIVDVAWTSPQARRRGSGVGAFVGIPLPGFGRRRSFLQLPRSLAALGFGYQFLWPVQPDGGAWEDESLSKISVALAVPLERWARGLSLGIGYSRLVSFRNFDAQGVNQLDFGIGYWLNRFVAFGVVARAINFPRDGDEGRTQSMMLEPEVAFRPGGTPAIELAAGLRYTPYVQGGDVARFRTFYVEPRGRVRVRIGPARLFVEGERMRYFPAEGTSLRDEHDALRVSMGVEIDMANFGVSAGVLSSTGARSRYAVDGGAFRVRISQERYDGVTPPPLRVTRLQLSAFPGDAGMWELVSLLDEVGGGEAVLIETRGMRFGWAELEELREAVLRVRARGGKSFVYLEGGGLAHYFLASAADEIIAHPTNSLELVGMRVEVFYFADLLAKLGARAEFVRIAEYKSRPEQFTGRGPTEAAARQRRLLETDVWNHVVRTLARERGYDPGTVKDWIDNAPIPPRLALQRGIVDGLAHPDELDERIESFLDRKIRIERPSVLRKHRDEYGPRPRIAVLVIEGTLAEGESFDVPLLGAKIAGSYTLTRAIEALREDKGVRAIVVRIDSPGGSVAAADAIARELDLTRSKKPVVVSMGNRCASGGYYIATAGQYIFADATTVTGSIGVFQVKLDLSGTLERFGIGVERHELGRRAAMRSWWKPYSEDERAAVLRDLQDQYDIFVARVGAARNMTEDRVDRVARGRVWSGVRASEIGLVDAYGGLRDAVLRARAIAGLDPNEGDVVLVPSPPSQLEQVRRLLAFDVPGVPFGAEAAASTLPASVPRTLVQLLQRLPLGLLYVEGPATLAHDEASIVLTP